MISIYDEKLFCILNQIREKERDVILLNVFEDMTLLDVAKVLDMNYSTVRNNKSRGLERLKELIKKYGLH